MCEIFEADGKTLALGRMYQADGKGPWLVMLFEVMTKGAKGKIFQKHVIRDYSAAKAVFQLIKYELH